MSNQPLAANSKCRRPSFEDLETRKLMASDLVETVPITPIAPIAHERVTLETQSLDTDGDQRITHKDAWLVTNFLTQQSRNLSSGNLTDTTLVGESESSANLDVNSDGMISPADVLWVVDRIQFYNPLVPCNCSACVQTALSNSCSSVEIGRIQAITMTNSPIEESQADAAPLHWNTYPAPPDLPQHDSENDPNTQQAV